MSSSASSAQQENNPKKRKQSSLLHTPQDQQLVAVPATNNEDQEDVEQSSKKRRLDNKQAVVLRDEAKDKQIVISGPKRTSSLAAPILQLEGHTGAVYTTKFQPNGQNLASAGHDKQIFLWNVFGEIKNHSVLKGHLGPVTEVCWTSDSERIFSSSADKSVIAWDATKCQRITKYKSHNSIVNSVTSIIGAPHLCVSGSDDATTKIFDLRASETSAVQTFECKYPVLSVAAHSSNYQLFTAGIDNVIKVWDTRISGRKTANSRSKANDDDEPTEDGEEDEQEQNGSTSAGAPPVYTLQGHRDTITGIQLSPDQNYLLSNSMDNSLIAWDVRPFVKQESRFIKHFMGHRHGFDKNLLRCAWSPAGNQVTCGSADSPATHVHIWDFASRQLLYKLPGHKGTVNEVVFHPTEPIIASCSNDKTIYIGEIEKE